MALFARDEYTSSGFHSGNTSPKKELRKINHCVKAIPKKEEDRTELDEYLQEYEEFEMMWNDIEDTRGRD